MTDREKVIEGLKYCTQVLSIGSCAGCPYADVGDTFAKCGVALMFDCLDLLKAQEPRVMTDREWLEWKTTPPSQRDPIYCENHDGTYVWLHPNDILQIHILTDWGYGIVFRCWTAKPTKEQSEAVKWND